MSMPCIRVLIFRRVFRVVIIICGLLFPAVARSSAQDRPPEPEEQRQAKQLLNEGVQAFKNGQYEDAKREFSRAKQPDPHLLNARLCLPTTYASQYFPGAPSEETVRQGQKAITEFKYVVEIDPQNLSATDGLSSMLFQTGGQPFDPDLFAESNSYPQKHTQLRPQDPDPYYWIGVIDRTLAFRANGQIRARFNLLVWGKQLSKGAPLPPELRDEYDREYGVTIEEGVKFLEKALVPRPDYDDAVAYLNLLYRRKADQAYNDEERADWTKRADDLIDKIKEIKQKMAETPN